MEYLWHNSTNEHKITYSHKGRFCFFLFFASPVATFFHYFAQNVRVTPNLRKKGGERRRTSKKQFYYSKTPCEKKVPRRRAISSKYSSPWKIAHAYPSWNYTFNIWLQKWKFRCFFAIYSQPVFTTAPVYIDWLLSQSNLLFSKVEEYFPVISSFFA